MQNRVFPTEPQPRLSAPQKPSRPQGWIQQSLERVEELIAAHPAATLAAGVTLGVTLGWLIKRKT